MKKSKTTWRDFLMQHEKKEIINARTHILELAQARMNWMGVIDAIRNRCNQRKRKGAKS